MRIKHKVNVKIADDADMKDLLFSFDDTLSEVIIDGYTKQASGKFKILATENENLPLGDVEAVKGVYLKVSRDCILKLNGGTEEIQLRRAGALSTNIAKFFIEADITQINLTAPATEDLVGTYCVWGDPAE